MSPALDRSLLPRIASSILLAGLLLATVYWSREVWPLCLLVCEAVTLLGLRELNQLLRAKNIRVFSAYTLLGGAALTAAIFFSSFPKNLFGDLVLWVFLGWCVGLFFLEMSAASPEGAMQSLFSSIGILLYFVFLFGFLIRINYMEGLDGRWYVLFTFLTVYSADIGAYGVGTLFGKRPLAPIISPKKTVEGALGGLLGACAAAAIGQKWLLPQMPLSHAIVLGVLIGVVSQVGDLWESLLKRDAQVKDSGAIIPGMGGVLDLMDGLLFCAPVVYLYLKLFIEI